MRRRSNAPLLSRTEASRTTLAHDAVAKGRAALAAQDVVTAVRWFDRAHRLVPADPNVMLSLASACLDTDPRRAAFLFETVSQQHDIRHAWLGLAAALLRRSGPAAAARPLSNALSRHAFIPDMEILAGQIAQSPHGNGWCGLTSDGTLVIRASDGARIEVRLDGRRLTSSVLPADWSRHQVLCVEIDGRDAIGSPIRIDRVRRVVGCVEAVDGGIAGWAWHPGDPDRSVALTLWCPRSKQRRLITADTLSDSVPHAGPMARPRVFELSRDDLAWATGPIHVTGPDGKALLGSPLDPAASAAWNSDAAAGLARLYPATAQPEAAASRRGKTGSAAPLAIALRADAPVPPAPIGVDARKRGVTVVIPIHNGGQVVRACLDSVLTAGCDGTRIIVVDDGSTEPELVAALDGLAARRSIVLIRHASARGFPASANAGIIAAAGRDVVLLNSDTLVPPGWLERLRSAAYSARDVGSVTPLSNNATILSYPAEADSNPEPDQASVNRTDAMARRANADRVVDIPVGVGFCLYLRRDCLNATGLLRADVFAQGYGEENDFCLRARRLGWRHVAATGVFVGHHGGSSFDATALHLRTRNARLLEQMHPGHDALIARFIATEPLAEDRRRIDVARWRAASVRGQAAAILISHNHGGGVEQCVARSVAAHRAAGRRPIVLRPVEVSNGELGVAVHDGLGDLYPNLRYAVPRELSALKRLLSGARPDRIEVHHLLDHDTASIEALVTGLQVPYDVHVHDYGWFCPRLSLLGAHDRYCGEPDLPDCEDCVADLGHFLREDISVAALRERSAMFLANARAVVAPSVDAATRMRRHFGQLVPSVVAHEDDTLIEGPARRRHVRGPHRVCVVGGIGLHKGYAVLLSCARDAARRDLDLEFRLVGHSIDDERLLATGRVFITGRFKQPEAVALICAQEADLGFVPSIWPETWCLSLGDIWRAGLPAAAFDLGAPAERIRRTGRGFLLPLGLGAGAINNALLAAARANH